MRAMKIRYLSIVTLIVIFYVSLTYLSSIFGLSSGVIQIRLAEAVNTLACYTSAAIPGMFVGCLIANFLTGSCAIDFLLGGLATFIGVSIGRRIAMIEDGKYNMYVPIPTIVSNAILIPIVLRYGYGYDLPYWYMFTTIGLSEVISAGLVGEFLYLSLLRTRHFRGLVKSVEQYPDDDNTFDEAIEAAKKAAMQRKEEKEKERHRKLIEKEIMDYANQHEELFENTEENTTKKGD